MPRKAKTCQSGRKIEGSVGGSKEAHLQNIHARKMQCVSVVEWKKDSHKVIYVVEVWQVLTI